MPPVPDLEPRKAPSRARGHASVDAMLEACAQLLRDGLYADMSTNMIAERAGVGIGTLYEFFPNKEAIIAALARRKLAALFDEMRAAADVGVTMELEQGTTYWLTRMVDYVRADKALFQVLMREIPFLNQLPEMKNAVNTFEQLAVLIRDRVADVESLPEPEVNTWLVSRSYYNLVFDLALRDEEQPPQDALIRSFVRSGMLSLEAQRAR